MDALFPNLRRTGKAFFLVNLTVMVILLFYTNSITTLISSIGNYVASYYAALTTIYDNNDNENAKINNVLCVFQACFASLVSQDYVNGTDQEEIRTGW